MFYYTKVKVDIQLYIKKSS